MRIRSIHICLLSSLALLTSCGGGNNGVNTGTGGGSNPPPASTAAYTLVAWSELGMHCIDGKDYSIFAVLPPYNVVRAQLIKRGDPSQLVSSGVTITYEAVADAAGSINTSSSGKSNFWTYANPLFLTSLALDVGLTGKAVQSHTPQPMDYDSQAGVWAAVGIPTVPYDDRGTRNAYPMGKVVAKDSNGTVLATAKVVLAVSDELTCSVCHASGSNAAAQPASGWENDPDPARDVKLNILKLHDQKSDITAALAAIATSGYHYQSSLYSTAKSGTPILCATCHSSNALGTAGVPGVEPVTTAMHSHHASVVFPASGTSLDNATSPFASCYLCHPGLQTRCQRGAMNGVACMSCHGNLSAVGNPARVGWMDLPSCQNCHANSQRFTTTFDGTGQWRNVADAVFATNPNVPMTGKHLYRFSKGHGGLYCSACHGSPHAEYPTNLPNDNVYSNDLQGHSGMLAECATCHTSTTVSSTGGPHGIHTIGQTWVNKHHSFVDNGAASCAYCHGADFKGSALSQTRAARSFTTEDSSKSYPSGGMVSCYDCHNGPSGG